MSLLFDCEILEPITLKQFISPIPLVQFNWYCERGGDDDESLTCGRDLIINLFFPKDVYRRSLFFLLVLHARSRVLASVLQKNKKRNKTTSVYRLTIFWASGLYILDLRQLEIDLISLYKAPQFSLRSKAPVNQTFLTSLTSRVSPHTKLYLPGSPQGIADDRCICHWINQYPVDKC